MSKKYTTPFVNIGRGFIMCYSATEEKYFLAKFNGKTYKSRNEFVIDYYIPMYKAELRKRLPPLNAVRTKYIMEESLDESTGKIYYEDVPSAISLRSGVYSVVPVTSKNKKKLEMEVQKYTNNGKPDCDEIISNKIVDDDILKKVYEANDKLLSKYAYDYKFDRKVYWKGLKKATRGNLF